MSAIAASAFAFAFLPMPFSAALTVAVCGGGVIDGMGLPVVTRGDGLGRWLPWVVWLLALMACPVAICIVAVRNPRIGPPAFGGPLPWAAHLVEGIAYAQLAVSVVAWILVVAMVRGGWRWLAWAGVLVIGALAWYLALFAWMSVTGIYL